MNDVINLDNTLCIPLWFVALDNKTFLTVRELYINFIQIEIYIIIYLKKVSESFL